MQAVSEKKVKFFSQNLATGAELQKLNPKKSTPLIIQNIIINDI